MSGQVPPVSSEVKRKLTTILAADAEGYSRMMQVDEVRGVGALRDARAVFTRLIDRHGGRIANTAGDGLIAEFPSVVEAVHCAIEVQNELTRSDGPEGGNLQFRIGIHLGDVIEDGDDLLGEGVNLAARLQGMAPPGGILISRPVYDQVHAKLSVGFDYLGEKRPRNFSHDVSVYQITTQASVKRLRPRVEVASDTPPEAPVRHPQAEVTTERWYSTPLVKRAALICGALVVIDIASGPGTWAQFPVIVLASLMGLVAVPSDGWRGFGQWTVRAGIIVAMLLLLNLVAWQGTFWAIWPAGALAILALWRALNKAPS